jgi:hypothetical protein
MNRKDMKQLKSTEVTDLRNEILASQNGNCGLCNEPINENTGYSLDHQHKTSKETIGEDGAGLVRGVLCRACNVWEGKIWNNTQRYRQPKNVKDRIGMLSALIQYYEKGTYNIIHHTEKAKEPTVSKRNYNKLMKTYTGKKKFPEYPKSGKLTLALQMLFEEYEIPPYN